MAISTIQSRAPSLGIALRTLRQERGLSLAAASALTGMSVATLSKVENGKRTLAYDKLIGLARALEVDISRLFSNGEVAAPQSMAAGRRSVQPSGEGFIIEAGVYTYTYLAHDLSRKRFSPVVMELHARSRDEFETLLSHEGEEQIYVLEGEVIVYTEIYEPLRLKIGDSVYLDSTAGHAYVNGGAGRAKVLCIASIAEPQEKQEMPVAQKSTAHLSVPIAGGKTVVSARRPRATPAAKKLQPAS